MLEGLTVAQEGLLVSHLQFADDTLVLCRGTISQMRYLCCVIRWFEVVSGLRVTLSKSRLFGVGKVSNLRNMVEVLGCQVDNLPSSYHGLPLVASYKRRESWNLVINRI